MAINTVKATLPFPLERVWTAVTSLTEYQWRSDLDRIEVLEEGKVFAEHTKDGITTTFTITKFEPMKQYEFEMENDNMKGHWRGTFGKMDGQTTIDFVENVTAKKLVMKPFVKSYLKKQQTAYLEDLRAYLSGSNRS